MAIERVTFEKETRNEKNAFSLAVDMTQKYSKWPKSNEKHDLYYLLKELITKTIYKGQ